MILIFPRRASLKLLSLICSLLPLVADAGVRTIAVFGDAAAAQNPPSEWQFQWNPEGEIGDFSLHADLQPLVAEGRRGMALQARGVMDEAGTLRADRPSVTSGGSVVGTRDEAGAARWSILSFTLPQDSEGDVWLQHGNLQNRSFGKGTELKIFVNGKELNAWNAERNRVPLLFQQALGPLRKGDTVTLAVGPGPNGKSGGGRMRYILEDIPSGQTPLPPNNIVWQPIDASFPQFTADGASSAYEKMHQEQSAIVETRKPEIVFIGDSITTRWPQELLEEHYGDFRPVNLGVGGDWVQNVHWRILNGSLDQAPVKAVVLLIGTNNLSNQFTPEEVSSGIARLAETLKSKLPQSKILILGVLPRGASIKDPVNETIGKLNTKLRALADDKTIFYLDVGPALIEPNGEIAPEIMPDRLHVAQPGYLRWMHAMKPTLDQILGRP